MSDSNARVKVLSVVEATTINAVAKSVLEFDRTARELAAAPDFPAIENVIATFERPGTDSNEFVAAARAQDLQVGVIPERRRFDLKVIPSLRAIIEQQRPEVVVTHSVKSHFLFLRSRLWRKIPWVAFHHGYTTTDTKMRLYNRFDRWSLRKADRVVTVCNAFARELAETAGVSIEKILVQHNSIRPQSPVNADAARELRAQHGIGNGDRVVLAVGRLSREKAHLDLLKAFRRLGEIYPELGCKLLIAGDGPERSTLEAAAESFGLKEKIIFAGQTDNVQQFYAAADVLALPSHSEGSPYVLLEAMAAGVPIVATAVGGVPEMASDHESALLVPSGDHEALATAVGRVLTDRDLSGRLVANASELARSRFSPEQYARSLLKTYREVIASRT